MPQKLKNVLHHLTPLIGLLLIWQLIVLAFNLPTFILPGPWIVFQAFIENIRILLSNTVPTVIETLLGLLFGTILGCSTALIMHYCKPLSRWILPVLLISQALPTFAIAPLFVIWFGYSMASKIAITVLMIFFPIASSFYDGLKNIPEDYLELAHVMNGQRWYEFLYIRIPAALPHLASGLRIAATFAPMGAVIGEWVGANQGLGFLMLNSNARMQIDLMFACLFLIVFLALGLYYIIDRSLQRLIPWQYS